MVFCMKQFTLNTLFCFSALLFNQLLYAADSTRIPLEEHSPVRVAYLLDTGITGNLQIYSKQLIAAASKPCMDGYKPKGQINLLETDPGVTEDKIKAEFHDINKFVINYWQEGYTLQADQIYAFTPGTAGKYNNTALRFTWTFYCIPA